MKSSPERRRRLMWAIWLVGLLGFAVVFPVKAQNTTVFGAPMQYCFSQLEWSGDLSKTTLSYHLIIEPQHHFKEGDVFIGFRNMTRSGQGWDAMWLRGNLAPYNTPFDWYSYGTGQEIPVMYRGILQPIIPVSIVSQPIDLTEWVYKGEFMAGYGLRVTPDATATDSFQEMLDNKRYHTVWVVQEGPAGNNIVCLKATEMTVTGVAVPF